MEALSSIVLPFTFSPLEIKAYKCEIILSKDDELEWIFPIEGITESKQDVISETIVTKCREKVIKSLKI